MIFESKGLMARLNIEAYLHIYLLRSSGLFISIGLPTSLSLEAYKPIYKWRPMAYLQVETYLKNLLKFRPG